MTNQQPSLPAGWLPQKLREALAQLPGSVLLLPSLPVLEVGVMGQHVVVTFCMGAPPPTLLGPPSGFGPAVTLHLIWPHGYWYWQPETGTADYIGGVLRPELLPAAYQQVLSQRSQQPPFAAIDNPSVARYLSLLEEVLQRDWLSSHADVSPAEKQTASELQQLWSELGEAHYQDYYRLRCSVLLAWLTQATYQPCWVEQAIASLAATAPVGIIPADATQGTLFPAWLDGRQCVVVPFFRPNPPEAVSAGPAIDLLAACYVAYPSREVYWHQFAKQQTQVILATSSNPRPPAPPASKAVVGAELPTAQATRHYHQLVNQLLEAGWLVTHHAVVPKEAALASALASAFAVTRTSELSAYYLSQAWQLTGWLARAAKEVSP